MNRTRLPLLAIVLGPILALVVGASTSSVRDQVGASNVGIALAIIVVLAALVSRGAALTTAACAALTFNFFHTEPYHSLRISSSRDVTIVVLLGVLGVVVSDISAWLRRRETIASSHLTAIDAPKLLGALLETPHPVMEVWPAVASSIMDQLSLAECWFVRGQATELPLISRVAGRSLDGDDGFVLPTKGAAMPVVAADGMLGHLVLRPRDPISSLWVERRVVLALADHVAIALTYTGHNAGSSSSTKEFK